MAPDHRWVPGYVVQALKIVRSDQCGRLRWGRCGCVITRRLVGFETEVVQELGRRGSGWLEIPGFVKIRVMVGFDRFNSLIFDQNKCKRKMAGALLKPRILRYVS